MARSITIWRKGPKRATIEVVENGLYASFDLYDSSLRQIIEILTRISEGTKMDVNPERISQVDLSSQRVLS